MKFSSNIMLNYYGTDEVKNATEQKEVKDVWLYTFGAMPRLFSHWGHSRFVLEYIDGTYRYVDWGRQSQFYPGYFIDFISGRLFYLCYSKEVNKEEDLYNDYKKDSRSVIRQKINLSKKNKENIAAFVQWNIVKPNNIYGYQTFIDNCSIRLRDVLNVATDGAIYNSLKDNKTEFTYRKGVNSFIHSSPAFYWFLNFLMGMGNDKKLSSWDMMFLPSFTSLYLLDCKYSDGTNISSEIENLSESKINLKDYGRAGEKIGLFLSLIIGATNAFFIGMLVVFKKSFKRIINLLYISISFAIIFCFACLGVLLYIESFYSLFMSYWNNINIICINPFLILFLIFFIKGKKLKEIFNIKISNKKVENSNLFLLSFFYTTLSIITILLGLVLPQENWYIILPFLTEFIFLMLYSVFIRT